MMLRQRVALHELPELVHAPRLGRAHTAVLATTAVLDDRGHAPLRRLGIGVAHEVDVDDEVDRLGDQRPHRVLGQLGVALGDVERQAAQHCLDGVRVDRGHRAALAHRCHIEHLQRLVLDQLTDDHPVGVQPPGQLDQLARRHRTAALGVGLTGEQRRRVGVARIVLEAQLQQALLDRDDPFQRRDRTEQFLQQGGLAGTGTAGDQDRHSRLHERLELGDQPPREQPTAAPTRRDRPG